MMKKQKVYCACTSHEAVVYLDELYILLRYCFHIDYYERTLTRVFLQPDNHYKAHLQP